MHDTFRTFSTYAARAVGSGWTFLLVILIVLATGYYYRYSRDWMTIASFFAAMISLSILILLQRSQNHNDKATHIKLDELINAVEGARDEVVSVEDESEKKMDRLKETNPAEGDR